jgi:hypothetical protein
MRDISGRSAVAERMFQFLQAYKFYWISSMVLVLLVLAMLIILWAVKGPTKPFIYALFGIDF